MLRMIRQWLGGRQAPRRPDELVQAAPGPAMTDTGVCVSEATEPARVWGRFAALMLGVEAWSTEVPGDAEHDLVRHLETVAGPWPSGPRCLPRLPPILPDLLGVLCDPDAALEQVAAVVARDPELAAALTRMANSAPFRTARPLSRLRDAVLLIGHDGLRRLLPVMAVQPVFHEGGGRYTVRAGPHVWAHAQRHALAAMVLCGGRDDVRMFEYYLAGLARGAGLMAAMRMLDAHPARVAVPRSRRLAETLHRACAALATEVALGWGLPDGVVGALRDVPAEASPAVVRGTVAQAEYVALVRALAHQGLFRDELASLEPRLPGVGRARLQRCYSELLRFDESDTPD